MLFYKKLKGVSSERARAAKVADHLQSCAGAGAASRSRKGIPTLHLALRISWGRGDCAELWVLGQERD